MKKKIGRNKPCICGSGKKFKRCCIDKEILELEDGIIGVERKYDENVIEKIFAGDNEALTDELIEELVQKGWEREHLLFHRENNGSYCRERNTILYPPEFEGFDD